MSWAKKVDSNQKAIVALGRKLGADIAITSFAGDGFPDTVWQFWCKYSQLKMTHLVEIKDGNKPPSRQRLTPDQEKFHAIFDCTIVKCEADVFKLMGIK